MSNFSKNLMGGLFVAFYLMCFVFPVELVFNMFRDHLSIEQFLINQILTFFAIWIVGYFLSELYRDLLAQANTPRDQDKENQENKKNKKPDDEDQTPE